MALHLHHPSATRLDLDAIERAAMAATVGGRTAEPHPFRPATECVLIDDDGDAILEGSTADVQLAALLTPAVVLELVRIARAEGREP